MKSTTPQADLAIRQLGRACDALAQAAFDLDTCPNTFAKAALIVVEQILDDLGEECDNLVQLRAKLREINNDD
jgi:hypothetical protein